MGGYPYFPERGTQSLDGFWDFAWLGGDADLDAIKIEALDFNERMAVPGVFDTGIDRFGVRGTGVYKRAVSLDAAPDALLRLKLGGLGLYAKLYWDGKAIGECRLPYSTVSFDFRAGKGRTHELAIAVDNRFDKRRCPLFLPYYDFYAYGGVYRSVELQKLPATRLERAKFATRDFKKGLVELTLALGGEIPSSVEFSVRFDSGEERRFKASVANGKARVSLKVPNFKVWSPDSPNLHLATVSIAGDSVVERFGIRSVETQGTKLLLNGEPLLLKGVNRHEAHPESGPVQNLHLMADDLRILKDLGCNFVRCVHYPQSQEFLDLCDETGLLAWQESMGWNNPESDALDPDFFKLQVEQTRLMVENGSNHPAVILWGFLNECCSETEGGRKLYKALAETIRAEEPSLLVTYASSKGVDCDICFDLADVAAINIYPGWCSASKDWTTPISSLIPDEVARCAKVASTRALLKDKPLIVSEIGACGLYGCHDRANAQWSEEFQSDYMATAVKAILREKRYSGVALWQFFDARSFVNAGQVRCKPRGFNCAGLLDEYRRPKLAYDSIRALYRKKTR